MKDYQDLANRRLCVQAPSKRSLFFVIFLSFYVSLDSFLFGINANSMYSYIMLGLYVITGMYSFYMIIKQHKNISFLLFIIVLILLSSLMNLDISAGIFLQMIVFIIGYYISTRYSFKEFAIAYDKVFFFISLSSIVIHFLYIIKPGFFSFFPVMYDSHDLEYIFVGFSRIYDPGKIIRNSGFFREPGVFAVYLAIVFLINLFYFEKKNKWHILVYIIAMITTLSTAGYVLFLLIVPIYFLSKGNAKNFFIMLLLLLAMGILYYQLKDYEIIIRTLGKFDSDNEYYGSTISRLASFFVPLHIAMNHPIFGAGLEGFSDGFLFFSKKIYNVALASTGQTTNTYMNIAATYGVMLGLLYLNMIYRFCKKMVLHRNILIIIFLFVTVLLALSNEDIRYSVFFSTLLFYGAQKDYIHR